MSGEQTKPDRVDADKAIFLSFTLNDHAELRIAERSTMTPAEVLDVLNTGRSVRLNDPARHFQKRAYYLFFSARDNKHLVAVTRPSTELFGSGAMVTLLTQEQYENDHGRLHSDLLLKAARQVLDRRAYESMRELVRQRREDRTGLPFRRKDMNVSVHYWADDFQPKIRRIGAPRVPMQHLLEHGLAAVHRHPAFWTWLQTRLAAVGLDLSVSFDRIEVSVPGEEPVQLDHGDTMVDSPAAFPDSEFELTDELSLPAAA